MGQSYPINGGTTSCRRKSTLEEYKQRKGITDDLHPAEKIEKLHLLFKALAASTHAISDNLQPGELQRRLADPKVSISEENMEELLDENIHAVELLRDCVREIAHCRPLHVKGTVTVFTACNKTYHDEAKRLETGIKELGDLLHSKKSQFPRPAVACLAMQLASFLLVFEELLAA